MVNTSVPQQRERREAIQTTKRKMAALTAEGRIKEELCAKFPPNTLRHQQQG